MPHVLRASGEVLQITCKPEMPLGVRSKIEYQTSTIALRSGDAVFVISDGIVEAMNADGELYTLERLNADLRGAAGVGAAELVRKVTENVSAFTGSAPKRTMLLRSRCAGVQRRKDSRTLGRLGGFCCRMKCDGSKFSSRDCGSTFVRHCDNSGH